MVSYEIPLGLSIVVGVLAAGTLNMVELGHLQGGGIHTWVIFKNPFVFASFFVYFIGYAATRFVWTYFRVDSSEVLGGLLRVPQLVSLIVIAVSLPLLWITWRRPREGTGGEPEGAAARDFTKLPADVLRRLGTRIVGTCP